jgi:RES domain-containing protein
VRDAAPPAWRAFPWSRTARPGEKFSASFVPASGGTGRFDLPGERVLYLAETPEHAIAEKIARFRGTPLQPRHLREYGLPLALASVAIDGPTRKSIADLCDPKALRSLGIAPDRVAARDREATQAIAALVAETGASGLRWWSAFFGEWHTLALFVDRLPAGALAFGTPRLIAPDDPALAAATSALGIRGIKAPLPT